ncbi:MAG: hypothetical protein ABJM39_08925 [Porticoccus sp.]|jgi:hypothetical protein|uniref:hypothetical protein n=1 Tax=Porticoccus sp. TaxID=2024853 RepID=UPI003298C9B3
MLQRWFGIKSASKYAWVVPAVVSLALLLIYFFGNGDNRYSAEIHTLSQTENYQRLQIDQPANYADLEVSAPLSEVTRGQILNNLSELRAEYKLVGPQVIATAEGAHQQTHQLAQTIGGLLAHYNLGQFRADAKSPTATFDSGDDVIIYTRPKDASIARGLVESISPLLVGEITLVFNDKLQTGHLLLVVKGEPAYTEEGIAVFDRAH